MTGSTIDRTIRFRAAERRLHADPTELRRHQVEALQAVVRSARGAEPYRTTYRRDANHGVALEDLPLIDRETLASFPLRQRLSTDHPNLVTRTSSGSSGVPLELAWSPAEQDVQDVLLGRQIRAQGMPLRRPPFMMDLRTFKDHVTMQTSHGSFELKLSEASIQVARRLVASGADVLIGCPSLLLELADAVGDHTLHGVITFGEVTEEAMRTEIERVFTARTFDLYASAEAGLVSWECPHGNGYHINAEAVVVEVVDEHGRPVPPGEIGELVVTNLWNHTTPVIRYRTGDVGRVIAESCPCGVTLPVMDQVAGRRNDQIQLQDGGRISPLRLLLVHYFDRESLAEIRRYRIVQREIDDFLVEVEWRDDRREAMAELIQPALSAVLGTRVSVEVRDVQGFAPTRLQKFKVVESQVPLQV